MASCTLIGIDAILVAVEVDIAKGLPSYHVVGLAAPAVREGGVRIRSALARIGHDIPGKKVTVNLAPADVRKPGSGFDLPIAAGIVLASEVYRSDAPERRSTGERGAPERRSTGERGAPERRSTGERGAPERRSTGERGAPERRSTGERGAPERRSTGERGALDDLIVMGELGLAGDVRAVRGVLAAAMLARDRGMRGVVVPAVNAGEALVVDGIEVFAVDHLSEVVAALAGNAPLPPGHARARAPTRSPSTVDMAEVRGQRHAREAMEIAVAGGHNVVLVGPPGIGKTMLARRVPTILPAMSHAEALVTTKVFSAAGLVEGGLVDERPFRSPHHTISNAALVGGGTPPRPGEISLAHNGVLFLDELPEFNRQALEALRQPLEDRQVIVARVGGRIRLPASFLLVGSANPCPCGWLGSGLRECTCGPYAIERYRSRLSGPLMDRMDLQVFVPPVALGELRGDIAGESSATIRDRVTAARDRQRHRLARWNLNCNAETAGRSFRDTCRLDAAGEAVLDQMTRIRPGITGRAIDRMIKVARTIADLDGRDAIVPDDLRHAASFRTLDRDAAPEIDLRPRRAAI